MGIPKFPVCFHLFASRGGEMTCIVHELTFFNLIIEDCCALSGIRGTYKREQNYLFVYKCRSKQNLL